MRRRITLAVLVITTVLIAGSSSFIPTASSRELQRPEYAYLNTSESLSFIPHTGSPTFHSEGELYTFNFSAEEGDKTHLKVSVGRQASVQIILMPIDEMSDYLDNGSFSEIEKISEASNRGTRSLEAHATIPDDGEYSLVIRHLDIRGITVEVIIGKGLFSSMVVRTGGYVGFFGMSSLVILVLLAVVYLYRYMKKKKNSFSDEGSKEWREEDKDFSEKDEISDSKDPPWKEDRKESSTDDEEYLGYED